MRCRKIGPVVLLAALVVVSQASATNLTLSNLGANGWKATTTSVYGGPTNATVIQTSDSFRFYAGPMPNSWQFQWATISTDSFAGMPLANITEVKIRSYGQIGDSSGNWQPPTFSWVLDKGGGNQRCVTWKPWSNGNARQPGVWAEYDAAVTGSWFVEETETYYNSLAALKAAMPSATFEQSADLPVDYGYASQHAFNVGFAPLYDQDRNWFGGTTGYVNWFKVGVNGVTTTYNLPEPASLVLLTLGGVLLGRRKAA